jgi:hypothetical protein
MANASRLSALVALLVGLTFTLVTPSAHATPRKPRVAANAKGKRALSKARAKAKATPLITFYLSRFSYTKTATSEGAIKRCEREVREDVAKHHGERRDPIPCNKPIVVRGPFPHRKPLWKGEDATTYRFKGSDGGWYDKDGDTECFEEGTPIATPDGDKPIESLSPGARVTSFDLTTKRLVTSSVTRAKERTGNVARLTLSNGATFAVTANHPFYSVAKERWITAGELAVGERLLVLDHASTSEAVLVAKTDFDRAAKVYEITVGRTHDYFAAGTLAHNY